MAKELLKQMLNLGKMNELKNSEMKKIRGGRVLCAPRDIGTGMPTG